MNKRQRMKARMWERVAEWKIWLKTDAINVYLSMEEVARIIGDFKNLSLINYMKR